MLGGLSLPHNQPDGPGHVCTPTLYSTDGQNGAATSVSPKINDFFEINREQHHVSADIN